MTWVSNSTHSTRSSVSHSSSNDTRRLEQQRLQQRGEGILHALDVTIRVSGIIGIVLFVATIVLLGLAQARYLTPIPALITFGAIACPSGIMIALDCIRPSVAQRHGIDLAAFDRDRREEAYEQFQQQRRQYNRRRTSSENRSRSDQSESVSVG